MPRSAAIATLAMVAAGTVKSIMPSALADNAHRSADSRTPFAGNPASVPASFPINSDPGASSAPTSTIPGLSAIERTSARPIRPPAPATINRMSDISQNLQSRNILNLIHLSIEHDPEKWKPVSATGLRLWAVVAFDDDDVGHTMWRADCHQTLIFRRFVTGQRRGVV